eukprot:3031906-Pyramimonas_sp.AAC.2
MTKKESPYSPRATMISLSVNCTGFRACRGGEKPGGEAGGSTSELREGDLRPQGLARSRVDDISILSSD